jgi:hypothetical protein
LLAFISYVALDLSSPFVPGAFNFNPEQCVEAAQRESQNPRSESAVTAAPRSDEQVVVARHHVIRRASTPSPRAQWRAPVAVTHAASPPSSSPPSPTEDH